MAEIRNGTLDSVITPTSIFFSHLDDQSFDRRCGSRPTGFAHAASIVLVCDELPMPCQQSFRSDDGCILFRALRLNSLARTARRRRWLSVKRSFLSPICSRRIRFSSTRYSIERCWFSLSQPARLAITNERGFRADNMRNRTIDGAVDSARLALHLQYIRLSGPYAVFAGAAARKTSRGPVREHRCDASAKRLVEATGLICSKP